MRPGRGGFPTTRNRARTLAAMALALALAVPALVQSGAVGGAASGRAFASAPTRTPPPTPVEGTPSPFPTVLRTPHPSTTPPALDSREAILVDLDTGQILLAKRAHRHRAIASLTKIMTAVVVLERRSPSSRVTVSPNAASQGGSVLGLETGERISVGNLLYALMLQSSNDAAVALAEAVSGTVDRFVALMNVEARAIGLRDTRFYSPNGLDDRGYSTAADIATLTRIAERKPGFADVVATKTRWIPSPSGPRRYVQNRNVLLWLYPGATGVKTGFTTPAGHCLVATASREGHALLAVVLGDPEEPFDEGATLLNFGFDAFVPVTLVGEGQAVGTVSVAGERLDAVSGGTLDGWVRRDLLGSVERTLVPDPAVRPPVAAGQRVGTVIVRVRGRSLGTVPAVAASLLDVRGEPVRPAVGRQPVDDVAEILGLLVRSVFGSFL